MGRPPRKPNRATIVRTERARIAVENAKGANKKLGVDILEEFAHLFAGMAGYHQPIPPGQPVPPNREPNEEKFLTYAKLAVDTAHKVADFQSPKFRAVMVSTTPGAGDPAIPKFEDPNKIIDITDAATLARVYSKRIKQVQK